MGERYALLLVLGYSRLLWFQFYERQTMEVLMRRRRFYFGGVPWELLFDQLRIEDRRASAGELLKNAEFSRFSRHCDFVIRACRPYRAQTKGKVERPSYPTGLWPGVRAGLNDRRCLAFPALLR